MRFGLFGVSMTWMCVCVFFSAEVSFIWAAHQVHHSSEYYNLTTALRQSLTQQFTSWVRYHRQTQNYDLTLELIHRLSN